MLREENLLAHGRNFWNGLRVLVTGGAGFIGSHLVEKLVSLGAEVRVADNFQSGSREKLAGVLESISVLETDLLDMNKCEEVCRDIDVVMNLAAEVAGVDYNQSHWGRMFWSNSLLCLNMLEAARRRDVGRYLLVSSACVYPPNAPIPTVESWGFMGDPEPSNFGYGWAKRFAEVQARVYAAEYGMKVSLVRPYNAYGPRDNFSPNRSHVIPALIRKVFENPDALVVWGNGKQKRSFIYVADLVRGMLAAVEKCPRPDPINIGNNEEVEINQIIDLIFAISGKSMKLLYDESKPTGQLGRRPDLTKASSLIGFEPRVSLKEGLEATIKWYVSSLLQKRISS